MSRLLKLIPSWAPLAAIGLLVAALGVQTLRLSWAETETAELKSGYAKAETEAVKRALELQAAQNGISLAAAVKEARAQADVVTVTHTITTKSATGTYNKKKLGAATYTRVALTVTIITNGTGSGQVNVTLPNTSAQTMSFYGRRYTVGGQGVTFSVDAASGSCGITMASDNSYPGSDGAVMRGILEYAI